MAGENAQASALRKSQREPRGQRRCGIHYLLRLPDYRDGIGGQIKCMGAIDMPEINREIAEVMEGGIEAFKLRYQKYGLTPVGLPQPEASAAVAPASRDQAETSPKR